MLEDIKNAEGDQWFGFLLLLLCSSLVLSAITAIVADKTISCYYTKSSLPLKAFEVMHEVKADVNWYEDHTAFMSNNPEEIQKYLQTVKQCGSL